MHFEPVVEGQWLKLQSVISHDRPDFQFDQTIFS